LRLLQLTAPLQSYRPSQRMAEFASGLFHVEHSLLESEIPFGGTVGVVDQHQVRVVLQAFGLNFHSAAVLFDEFCEHEFQYLRPEWYPAKNIPGRDNVDAALTTRDRRDRGQAGKPILADADDLRTHVR